jgi:hypothetical protein
MRLVYCLLCYKELNLLHLYSGQFIELILMKCLQSRGMFLKKFQMLSIVPVLWRQVKRN